MARRAGVSRSPPVVCIPGLDKLSAANRDATTARRDVRGVVRTFATPNSFVSAWQFANSLALFLISCAAMHWAFSCSYILTLCLALPAAGLLVRLFIIQHDCGHGAFFRSARANALVDRLAAFSHGRPMQIGGVSMLNITGYGTISTAASQAPISTRHA
jgi:omega-6 fatty acid desaturase (delta-12 desaturase)